MLKHDSLDIIKELLCEERCIRADGSKVSDAYLEEKGRDSTLKKLTLSGLRRGMLLLAIDEGRIFKKNGKKTIPVPCMSPLFSQTGKYDHNRACDFVLLKESERNKIEVYYLELKSGKPSGYAGQFKSTECFMNYVFDLSDTMFKTKLICPRQRFIIFHTDPSGSKPTSNKGATSYKSRSPNTAETPDKRCVKNNDTIRCTELF